MFSRWVITDYLQERMAWTNSFANGLSTQIFVANPRKPAHIENILRRNKAKLCTFLQGFQNDKDGELGTTSRAFQYMLVGWSLKADSYALYSLSDEQFIVRLQTNHSPNLDICWDLLSFLFSTFRMKSNSYYRKFRICKPRNILSAPRQSLFPSSKACRNIRRFHDPLWGSLSPASFTPWSVPLF